MRQAESECSFSDSVCESESCMFCVSGVKAHAEVLRLVATLLVLQLIRVKKLDEGRLLESLLRLKESQEPRYQHGVPLRKCIQVCTSQKYT